MADGSSKFKNSINLEPQSADPSNPAEGDTFCSDGTSRAAGYWQYINGAWSEFGGGGQGGINYLAGDNSDAENGIGDWVTYADAAGENAVDGTGGTALGVTLTQNTTSPLREDADFKFSKDAADRQGEGASVDFTIDNADKAQKLTISFDYDASSANYADDDIRIAIYDVTNANLIRVNGEDLKGGKGTHLAQFQTSADSTSYRLIIHQSSTNATAYDVYLDNIIVGPNSIINAPEIGEVGEILTMAADVTVQGPYLYCDGSAVSRQIYSELFDAVGTTYGVGDGSTTFNLPDYRGYFLRGQDDGAGNDPDAGTRTGGDTVGSTQTDQNASHTHTLPGFASRGFVSGPSVIGSSTSNTTYTSGSSGGNEARPINIAVKYYIRTRTDRVVATVGGGREVAARYTTNTEGTYGNGVYTTIPYDDIDYDTTSSYNTSTGEYTVPETGYYDINARAMIKSLIANVGEMSIAIYVDGVRVEDGFNYIENSTLEMRDVSSTIFLNKGQVVTIRLYQTNGGNRALFTQGTYNTLSISKRSSPQSQLETETVAARYTSDSGQGVAANTAIEYEDLDYDTHNAYNTSTGEYTVPVSGLYQVNAMFRTSSSTPSGIQLTVNGTVKASSNKDNIDDDTAQISHILQLNKGDVLEVEYNRGNTPNLIANALFNTLSIARIK